MRSVRGIENRLQLQGGDVGSRYADCSKEEETEDHHLEEKQSLRAFELTLITAGNYIAP